MQQQQQILTQRIFLAGPPQWDSWLTAVKTQALAKDVWQFSDPDGKGPAEPILPPEPTLADFVARHGISLPAATVPQASGNASAQPAQGTQPSTGTLTPGSQ